MRINKYLSEKGLSTRRGADKLILEKKVFINGKLAKLGDQIKETDKIEIKGEQKKYIYYAYNKPTNIISHSPLSGEKDILENIKNKTHHRDLFPLGRLDKDSCGLIILTNDGRITDKLLNPKHIHEKEYLIKTKNILRPSFKTKMERGVNIEGYITRKCKIEIINENTFKIILTEGKKHQIRRMCAALDVDIKELKRIRIMNIVLDGLKTGELREIKNDELETFLTLLSPKSQTPHN